MLPDHNSDFADALGWRPRPKRPEDYRYEWHVNNQLFRCQYRNLNPTNFSKGDTVFARVAPYDGESLGIAVDSAVMVIQNTAPQPPGIFIGPAAPLSTEDLNCQVNNASVDADQDTITYTYRWRRDCALTTITSSNVTSSVTNELRCGPAKLRPSMERPLAFREAQPPSFAEQRTVWLPVRFTPAAETHASSSVHLLVYYVGMRRPFGLLLPAISRPSLTRLG